MPRRVAVVDGYSSGRFLVQELLDRGAECIHMASSPRPHPYFARTFRPDDYLADLGYQPEAEKTVRRLDELGVEHIVAGTESGLGLADELSRLLGTPHNVDHLSLARRDKFAMATSLAAAGLDAPRSTLATSPDAAVRWYRSSHLDAVVLKPPASAGSDHVRVCRTDAEVADACEWILRADSMFGRPNRAAVVQEFLAGRESYVNTVTVNGRHVIVETWQYTKSRTDSGAPIFDFEEPADPDTDETKRVHAYVRQALTALGVRVGAGHSEVMMTARGPVLIDPGVRLGGGILPWVTTKFVGYSHAGLLAASILDPREVESLYDELPARWDGPIRYVSLINRTSGTVRSLDWVRRLESLPTVIALATGPAEGDHLQPTADLLSSPGFAYLSGARADVEADYQTIRTWERDNLYTT